MDGLTQSFTRVTAHSLLTQLDYVSAGHTGFQAALSFPLASTLGGTGVNNAGTITNATNTTITGGGSIALGGYTLTVPATGTAALLNQANSFTLINPLTTVAESWIGPSSTTGIYFKGGNVGIGTTDPTTADASARTFQIGDRSLIQDTVGYQTNIANNAHYDGSSWKYIVSDFANAIRFNGLGGLLGDMTFTTSPTGTAGNTITNFDGSDVRMVIKNGGNVGIGTTSPTNLLSLGGQVDRIFWLERMVTAATAGKALSVIAGGCVVGGTNLASGILKLGGQLATGSGASEVQIIGTNGTNNGATIDTTPAVMIDVINNKIGFYGVTPITRAVLATGVAHTVDDVITALQNLGLVSQS